MEADARAALGEAVMQRVHGPVLFSSAAAPPPSEWAARPTFARCAAALRKLPGPRDSKGEMSDPAIFARHAWLSWAPVPALLEAMHVRAPSRCRVPDARRF